MDREKAARNKKHTLQFQITLVVGIVLVFICAVLTVNSIYSADKNYGGLAELELHNFANDIDPDTMMEDEVTFADRLKAFSIQGVLVMLGAIGVSLVFIYWITGKMMRPLYRLTDSICRINEENLHQRLEGSAPTEEVSQLTESFNSMMDRLEKSFQVQRCFAANAAHELKTPLAAIKASLQVLQMDEHPEYAEYEEFTRDMEPCLERLVKTVDGLMFLASDTRETEDEKVRLKELLLQIKDQLDAKAGERQITIEVGGEEETVLGSPTLLYRGFYNLVENAVKYNVAGEKVWISIQQEMGRTAVEIADTGLGITPRDREFIFDAFYCADRSRSQKIEGTGLGLSIVKMIFDKFGCDIRVSGREEKGTKFTVLFPEET